MKKFENKAPFYSVQQETKFVNDLMRKVFKYPKEQYTQEAFDKIWTAIEFFGLPFIAHPSFGGNFKDMKPEYKKDYVTVLKKYFGLEWLAPFDNMVSPGKLIRIEKYIEDAIEAAGLDKDDIAKRNKQEIKSVAIACSQVLRDIEVLNDWRAFERFLRNGHAVLTWKGVSTDDMEAVISEILRAVRVYLWKDQPDNAYTYYR